MVLDLPVHHRNTAPAVRGLCPQPGSRRAHPHRSRDREQFIISELYATHQLPPHTFLHPIPVQAVGVGSLVLWVVALYIATAWMEWFDDADTRQQKKVTAAKTK